MAAEHGGIAHRYSLVELIAKSYTLNPKRREWNANAQLRIACRRESLGSNLGFNSNPSTARDGNEGKVESAGISYGKQAKVSPFQLGTSPSLAALNTESRSRTLSGSK
jgi:hypothetical protein